MKCLECFHFDKRNENGMGLCRANPPRPLGEDDLSDYRIGVWPAVNGETDWCGEFGRAINLCCD